MIPDTETETETEGTEQELAVPAAAGAGTLLPGVDPALGEIVLAAINHQPHASLGEIAVRLIRGVDVDELAVEMLDALVEMTVCRAVGELRWLGETGQTLLLGVRTLPGRQAVSFGGAEWPIEALALNNVTSVTIDTGVGRRRVWVASEPMGDIVVLQTEAIALGNALVEAFGGTITEDRPSRKTLKARKAGESLATDKAKARAKAMDHLAELQLAHAALGATNPLFARAALFEAVSEDLAVGDLVVPSSPVGVAVVGPDGQLPVFEVEARAYPGWVVIRAVEPGRSSQVEAASWVRHAAGGIGGRAGDAAGTTVGAALVGARHTASNPKGIGDSSGSGSAVSPGPQAS